MNRFSRLMYLLNNKTSSDKYETALSPQEFKDYEQFLVNENIPIPSDNPDYDMPGFFKALKQQDPRAQMSLNPNDKLIHFPDTWKTPRHKTFSNESIYATPYSPRWFGPKLLDILGNIKKEE